MRGRGPLHRTIRRPRINIHLQAVDIGSGVGAFAQYESRGAIIPEGKFVPSRCPNCTLLLCAMLVPAAQQLTINSIESTTSNTQFLEVISFEINFQYHKNLTKGLQNTLNTYSLQVDTFVTPTCTVITQQITSRLPKSRSIAHCAPDEGTCGRSLLDAIRAWTTQMVVLRAEVRSQADIQLGKLNTMIC